MIVAGWSRGSRERLGELLSAHGLELRAPADSYADAQALPPKYAALAVLGLETGFEMPGLAVIAEQDILGDRLVRRRKPRKGSEVLSEAASLTPGDLVVHTDHGIGRFIGLKSIDAAGAPHDCLELEYHGGDKLFLPVENIELLSRYGSDDANAALDRLGGGAWQARKARLKKRVLEMAGQLIEIAAQRATRDAPVLTPPDGLYEEFCARFGFDETEDQQTSIDAVLDDLAKGTPMDRLVCGDVGFGKTEVALRAALTAVMNGKQVAIVVPTTLLARQHYKTFTERFAGLPVRIAQASRLVSGKEMSQIRADLKSGQIDIVVRHPCAAGEVGRLQRSRPADHRRGAAFRRAPQGAAEGAEIRRPRPDADGHADSADHATCADGRPRNVDHCHAAGGPAGRAHLRHAVRSAGAA